MRGYGYARDYGGRTSRRRRQGRGRLSGAWLAEPVGGRVGYDRFYGEPRGARYGERYDLGYAPLSEMNPISRQLRREYHGLARGSWRRVCPPGYDYGY